MNLFIFVLIYLLYYFYQDIKKESFTSKIHNFNKNDLYHNIMDTHFTTDIYKNKHKLKKCCKNDCKAKAKYIGKDCDKNKKNALDNVNDQFKLQYTKEEFEKLKEKAEKYYGSAKNELDLRKIKLELKNLKDTSDEYNEIVNDTSYVIPGVKINLYPISVN